MLIKASLNYLRIAPRKVRLVANLVKGVDVKRAELTLNHLPRRSSGEILKLLKSAVANARHNFQLEEKNLFIKEIKVDSGPVFKRFRPRAFGRAAMIRKKTSHLSLVLDSRGQPAKKEDFLSAERKTEKKDGSQEPKNSSPRVKSKKSLIASPVKKAEKRGFARKMFSRKAI